MKVHQIQIFMPRILVIRVLVISNILSKKLFKNYLSTATVILVVLVILNSVGILNPVKGLLGSAFSPLAEPANQIKNSVGGFFSFFTKISDIQVENKKLSDENLKLKAEIVLLEEIKKENALLRNEIGLTTATEFNLVPAQILARDPSGLQQTVLINKGKKDGLENGMAVISNGVLIGQITNVQESSCTVLLITDVSSRFGVLVQESRLQGIIKGKVGNSMLLDLVPQGESLVSGQKIVTSGLNNFPKGIVIGEVEEVISKKDDPLQSANVKPLADLKKLEIVFVVIGVK